MLSLSHTPDVQTAVPTLALHVPLLCKVSVGKDVPLASLAVQVNVKELQKKPLAQSPSTAHPRPPEGTHLRLVEPQVPDRHRVAALPLDAPLERLAVIGCRRPDTGCLFDGAKILAISVC